MCLTIASVQAYRGAKTAWLGRDTDITFALLHVTPLTALCISAAMLLEPQPSCLGQCLLIAKLFPLCTNNL
jgi:hypothetical protein